VAVARVEVSSPVALVKFGGVVGFGLDFRR
jgi:hypothetical protein